ncbi:MAG: amidase domain-containing protein [Gemmataceae bacterium]|nr:amidase domain-containing protein [Gemmataceae bacterium]
MAINRDLAKQYAVDRWFTVCHDGVICTSGMNWPVLKGKAKTTCVFVGDGDGTEHAEYTTDSDKQVTIPWKNLEDCAHFVSCCLQAGGLQVPSPFRGVVGHVGVSSLVNWLHYSLPSSVTRTFKVGGRRLLSAAEAQAIIDRGELMKGDVIAYANEKGLYKHSTIYLGEGKITCHTRCRFGEPWDLGRGESWKYTLIHVL